MPHVDLSGAVSDSHLVSLWLAARPESTQRVYKRVALAFLTALDAPGGLKTATVAQVVAWMERLTGAPATKAREVSTVKSLLSFAWRTGYCVYNVGRALRCVKVPSTLHEKIVDESEISDLISAANPGRDRAFLRLMYASGARISELCALCFKDLVGARVSVVGKGTKSRTILVPQSVADEVRALKGPDDGPTTRIFRSYRGKPLGVRDARDIVYKTAERVTTTKLAPHWLRHAHASHALDHGAPIHLVQNGLGHANVATTSKYLHVKPNQGSSQYLTV